MGSILKKTNFNYPILMIYFIGLIFMVFAWIVSDSSKVVTVDRFFLYHVDDIFRYCYIKSAMFNIFIFLSPYVKVGYAVLASIFYNFLPFGMLSLRIMNVLFSCGILFLIYKLGQCLSFSKFSTLTAIVLTATFPVYFLLSISTMSEVMFSFFMLLAIYLLYQEKYNSSLFLTSLLPLFRQIEGIMCLFIWCCFFFNRYRLKNLFLSFIPFISWSIVVMLVLKYKFIQMFLYLPVPSRYPPNSMATSSQFLNLIYFLGYHPIIILSLMGMGININEKKYKILEICLISAIVFLLSVQVVCFFRSPGFLCRELRFAMPFVPIMGIFAASALGRILNNKWHSNKKCFILIFIPLLVGISIFQISKLQQDSTVIDDSINSKDEKMLKETNIWLNDYMCANNIKKICIPGGLVTNKIIRRIWMYLPGHIEFYAIGGDKKIIKREDINRGIFDIATFTMVNKSFSNTKSILISMNRLDDIVFFNNMAIDLIKMNNFLRLYFYEITYD